jgi:hypothetical protein
VLAVQRPSELKDEKGSVAISLIHLTDLAARLAAY